MRTCSYSYQTQALSITKKLIGTLHQLYPEGLKPTDVPAAPNQVLLTPMEEGELLSEEHKAHYRRVVGTLLYLGKSRHDISNALWELSKHAYHLTEGHANAAKKKLST